jgi:hypothetical protein
VNNSPASEAASQSTGQEIHRLHMEPEETLWRPQEPATCLHRELDECSPKPPITDHQKLRSSGQLPCFIFGGFRD